MESPSSSKGSYTWRIHPFSQMNQKYYSDVFIIGGCKWRILIFPKGNNTECFGIYLDVPDSPTLPSGWLREAAITFTMVNQNDRSCSTKKTTRHCFKAQAADWGFTTFMSLYGLICTRGFLVNDTVIVEAEVEVFSVVPPVPVPEVVPGLPNSVPPSGTASPVAAMNRFDSFFSKLEEFIVTAETSGKKAGPSSSGSNNPMFDLIPESPSLAEVEDAKLSLRECLSDIFKLNMKDRLTAALLTLTHAEVGLTSEQQKTIRAFWENIDEFLFDFLSFEQDNSEFELQKLIKDQMFSAIKKNRETHLSNKLLMESLNNEEEELKKRTEEVKLRKEKLMEDWESLVTRSEETKSKYMAQEKKLKDAEEKKRIAEENMSRSAAAWSSLKSHFL